MIGRLRGLQSSVREQILEKWQLPHMTWWSFLKAALAGYLLVMIPIIALNGPVYGRVADFSGADGYRAKSSARSFSADFSADLERQLDSLRKKTDKLRQSVDKLETENTNVALLRKVQGIRNPFIALNERISADLRLLYLVPPETAQPEHKAKLEDLMNQHQYQENVRLIKHELKSLSNHHEKYRRASLQKLTKKVQQRIYDHQHPQDCSAARKLSCNLNKNCGFGCQLHHVLLCLVASLALNRTMVLQSDPWNYSPNGWEKFFLPVSNCKLAASQAALLPVYKNEEQSQQYHDITYPYFPSPTPSWIPFALPKDLLAEVAPLHQQPGLWWIGQLVTYLWRLQADIPKKFQEEEKSATFKIPFVGIHVRRTDKLLAEARLHSIQSYIAAADVFWLQFEYLQRKPVPRTVFLASDDARVFQDFRRKFGQKIQVVGEHNQSRSSATMQTRYTEKSLLDLIRDIHFLSKSDFLVCTFSSLVCKMAYELKQATEDATHSFASLDDSYWLPGSNVRPNVVRYSQAAGGTDPVSGEANSQIELQKGDVVTGVSNLWTGFSVGTNQRTGLKGILPSFKIELVDQEAVFAVPFTQNESVG